MANLTERHEQLAAESNWDFSDLSALFINCTLKRSPEVSNTQASPITRIAIIGRIGVEVDGISSAPWTRRDRRVPGPDPAQGGSTTSSRTVYAR